MTMAHTHTHTPPRRFAIDITTQPQDLLKHNSPDAVCVCVCVCVCEREHTEVF